MNNLDTLNTGNPRVFALVKELVEEWMDEYGAEEPDGPTPEDIAGEVALAFDAHVAGEDCEWLVAMCDRTVTRAVKRAKASL